MDLIAWIPLIVRAVSAIKEVVDTNKGIVEAVTAIAPSFAAVLATIGSALFPKVEKELTVAAALMTQFSPDLTKWVQGSLNVLGYTDQNGNALVVDGIYGPRTTAAVEKAQAALGVDVDGWVGHITKAAIEKALSSKPVLS